MADPYYKVVADRLIAQLQEGTAPWQQAWKPGVRYAPMNPISGNTYKGANYLHLMMQGRSDPRWMTYRQAESIGAQVQKGQRGTLVQYWKFEEQVDVLDAAGRPVFDKDGRKVKETIKLERPQSFCAVVFNGEQIDGLMPHVSTPVAWDPVERAEQILSNSGAKITHAPGGDAYYLPMSDQIVLPEKAQFSASEGYYATALHELGHWTGHDSRLNRNIQNPFGSNEYAREELRAEIASLMLGSDLAIGTDHDRHASYVKSWIEVLQDDPLEIMRAAADAEKIKDFVMGFDQQLQQDSEERMKVLAKEDRKQKEYAEMIQHQSAPADSQMTEEGVTWGSLATTAAKEDFAKYMEAGTPKETEKILAEMNEKAAESPAYKAELEKSLRAQQQAAMIYIAVPYKEKDQARKLGAKWDRAKQSWYITADVDVGKFKKWLTAPQPDDTEQRMIVNEELKKILEKTKHSQMENGVTIKDQGEALRSRQLPEWESMARELAEADYVKCMEAESAVERFLHLADMSAKAQESPGYRAACDVIFESARRQVMAAPQWQETPSQLREYLVVPYDDRTQAKQQGARWDKVAKSWYVPEEATEAQKTALQRWKIDPAKQYQSPAMDPREEFAQALRDAGFILKDHEPEMDGLMHRTPVLGDKPGDTSGFYVGHLDGHPAGVYQNNRGGVKTKWKSTGHSLSSEERASLHAVSAQKMAQRAADKTQQYEETAERVRRSITQVAMKRAEKTISGQAASFEHPYLDKKGIKHRSSIERGLYLDDGKLLVPLFDIGGLLWNVQAITSDGDKRFAKFGKKEGCFHVIGGFDRLAVADTIILVEGFATGASINDVFHKKKVAVVVAFDAQNLRPVAEAIKCSYFEKDIIVAGDDDRHLTHILNHNVGRDKALEASLHVGGKAIYPVFSETEIQWDPSVPVFTPAQYKAHSEAKAALESKDVELNDQQREQLHTKLLPEAQLKELAKQRSLTDFNDLANIKDGHKRLASQLETAMEVQNLLRSRREPLDVPIDQVRVYGHDLILLHKPGQSEDQPFMKVFKQMDDGTAQFVGVFHKDKIERVERAERASLHQEAQQASARRSRKVA